MLPFFLPVWELSPLQYFFLRLFLGHHCPLLILLEHVFGKCVENVRTISEKKHRNASEILWKNWKTEIKTELFWDLWGSTATFEGSSADCHSARKATAERCFVPLTYTTYRGIGLDEMGLTVPAIWPFAEYLWVYEYPMDIIDESIGFNSINSWFWSIKIYNLMYKMYLSIYIYLIYKVMFCMKKTTSADNWPNVEMSDFSCASEAFGSRCRSRKNPTWPTSRRLQATLVQSVMTWCRDDDV